MKAETYPIIKRIIEVSKHLEYLNNTTSKNQEALDYVYKYWFERIKHYSLKIAHYEKDSTTN